MNLFVAGCAAAAAPDPERARRALADVLARAPLLDADAIESWSAPSGAAVLVWVAHAPERVGGVRYVAVEAEAVSLFCGRPVRWTAAAEADGRSPLDPADRRGPAAGWAEGLDGRYAAARYHDGERALEAVTDPLGAYPLYTAAAGGARWVSNSADALRVLAGATQLEPVALAGLLGGGWPLDGHPPWTSVERLERASVHRFPAGGAPERRALLPAERLAALPGAGFDPSAAGRVLVASVRAQADWPGRPSVVPVTGGRDSRLVLAAALAAGLRPATLTGGAAEAPDVTLGRMLAEREGLGHDAIEADPAGDFLGATARAAETLAATSGGTAALADAAGFPLSPRPGPVPLWHTGQGGEIGRGYYGVVRGGPQGVVDGLLSAFLGRRPGRPGLLSAEAVALVRERIRAFADEQLDAGAAVRDLPDLFYLLRRMATWAGPTHGCVEWVRDSTSPLWSVALLPHLLGPSARERTLEVFHLRVLEALGPDLVDLPFEGGRGWPSRQSALGRRLRRGRTLAAKAAAEARRRLPRRPAPGRGGPAAPERVTAAPPAPADPFTAVLALTRETVLSSPGHAAWGVLDRPRVESLLTREAPALDTMSRYYVWRLATIFLPEPYARASLGDPRPG